MHYNRLYICMLICEFRLGFDNYDYTAAGKLSFKKVYRGVGNSEVGKMLDQYFPELCKSAPMINIGE